MLTILDGTTFCISDDAGDVRCASGGFFAEDTRYVSELSLLVDGRPPLLLSSGKVEYFSAAFYLRNQPSERLPPDTLTIARHRVVDSGLTERVLIRNEHVGAIAFDVTLAFAADFISVLELKERVMGPLTRAERSPAVHGRSDGRRRILIDHVGSHAQTEIALSRDAEIEGGRATFSVALAPRAEWEIVARVAPSEIGSQRRDVSAEPRLAVEALHRNESLASWRLRVPRLETTWTALGRTYEQAVSDIASLRIRGMGTAGELPAAGMPWFMTVFGRDTLITCLETFLLGPDLARAALVSLAALQAEGDDPSIDAEPGKIIHELRRGEAARHWFPVYYGSADATPLFLVLLSELWRWTSDDLFVSSLRNPALKALRWIDEHGDRDGDGFVEYERRTPRGLFNQSWKDSGDSQRFADGRIAEPPIAPAEVQGYVYDAKLRAAQLARSVWRLPDLAESLEREAASLRDRFVSTYWVGGDGGYFALALDGGKRPVDSLASNIGHLMWSGIVPDDLVPAVVDRLLGPELWSGWGVRTLGAGSAAYNPLAYHNGTVWPHDTIIGAWGLARYGYWEESWKVVRGLLQAASYFGWSLPEVFAGYDRAETPFPIAYPSAAKPQAWAAASMVLGLQLLLGIVPDRAGHRLRSAAPCPLPEWIRPLRLLGVRAFDSSWNVVVSGGEIEVERA